MEYEGTFVPTANIEKESPHLSIVAGKLVGASTNGYENFVST